MPDSIFMGVPGANPSGMQAPTPIVAGTQPSATPLGAGSNPLLPTFPAGTSAPPPTFPANTGGSDPNATLTALSGMFPGGAPWPSLDPNGNSTAKDVANAFYKAGFPHAIGGLLASFLQQGAGFNPQAINALLAALQPQIQRGQANIMEQFGSQGLRDSSSAAIGLGDFNSQAVLDEGQIIAQMYEQSVQDYMNVLLAGKKGSNNSLSGLGALIGGGGQAASGIAALASL